MKGYVTFYLVIKIKVSYVDNQNLTNTSGDEHALIFSFALKSYLP